MKWFICKGERCCNPWTDEIVCVREIKPEELKDFEAWLERNKLHAYGQGYAHCFSEYGRSKEMHA